MTVDPAVHYYITGAPKIFKGKVLIGNGGTEHGAARGYVTAYDAETGEQAWRFWIVPGNPADGFENDAMAMAAETWTGEWWKFGGGGNAWHGFTYDAELDVLYIGTGNGSPWNRKIRSPGGGDNLFRRQPRGTRNASLSRAHRRRAVGDAPLHSLRSRARQYRWATSVEAPRRIGGW